MPMLNVEQKLLQRVVEVQEVVIGRFEARAIGRTKGKRQRVRKAVEIGAVSKRGERNEMICVKGNTITDYSFGKLSKSKDKMIIKGVFSRKPLVPDCMKVSYQITQMASLKSTD